MTSLPFTVVHIATMLTVRVIDDSVAFYRDKLGFEVHDYQPHIALLAQQGMLLVLIPESPPTSDKPSVMLVPSNGSNTINVNLVFRVGDCRSAYQELVKRGLQFLVPPQSPPWGGWRCFTRDPDTYLIEIEEP